MSLYADRGTGTSALWVVSFQLRLGYVIIQQWNLSNPTHQGTREMCQIVQDVRTCLIRHTKGPGKCVRLYRMSEYSGFILVNRNTLGPFIFVGCHRMSENSGVGLHKFHCIICLYNVRLELLSIKEDNNLQ
jgi:hypothetical protein